MSDKITIRVSARTNMVGSMVFEDVEFDKEYWEGLWEEEREDVARDCMYSLIEWNYEILEEED